MPIVTSELREVIEQADGSRNVIERHVDTNGKVYEFVYNAAAEMDLNLVMTARATRINSELAAREAAEAEATSGVLPLTHLQFLSRFTTAERIAIRAARATDPILDDFFDLLQMSDGIVPTHPTTQQGLGYLVQQGYLTAERAAEVGA